MEVVLIQPDIYWEDRNGNFDHIRVLLEMNPPPPGALVILPEMFSVGFSMNVERIHEGDEKPTENFLVELARKYQVFILGGLVSKAGDGRGLNQAVVIGIDGKPVVRYTKIHPFRYAGETNFYAAGQHVVTFDWQGFCVAPFICYDLRFPEIYRIAVQKGADLLITIANFPEARVQHWTSLLVARAIENQAYVIGVNRVGKDPNVSYPGRSLIVDPEGNILVDAGTEEGIFHAPLFPERVRAYRKRFPALDDLRPEIFQLHSLVSSE